MSAKPLETCVVVPARLNATRLPRKPLVDIAGEPMIVHVWRKAVAAGCGPVIVACAETEVADAVCAAGGTVAMTDADLPSGSDRVLAALEAIDPERRFDTVINLQGDLPTIEADAVRTALEPLADPAVDIGTLVAPIANAAEREDPNVVKAACALPSGERTARALYFSRSPVPAGHGPLYHHIGLYAFRRAALERFCALPPGLLEQREQLEQLRALEAGMRIDVAFVDTVPIGVDTSADLKRARALIAPPAAAADV